MKALIALVVLLALGTAAQARLTPNDTIATAPSAAAGDDAVMYPGPIGAMLEANYFRAPQPSADSNGGAQCRLRLYFSDQPFRLARSCN
jgi:hypothetical protein